MVGLGYAPKGGFKVQGVLVRIYIYIYDNLVGLNASGNLWLDCELFPVLTCTFHVFNFSWHTRINKAINTSELSLGIIWTHNSGLY